HLLPEVGEVLAHRVEAGGRGLAEVPDLRADLGHVTISPAGQRAGGCRILLAAANAPGQLLALGLQSSYPRLQIVERSHDGKAIRYRGRGAGVVSGLWTRWRPVDRAAGRPGARAGRGVCRRPASCSAGGRRSLFDQATTAWWSEIRAQPRPQPTHDRM